MVSRAGGTLGVGYLRIRRQMWIQLTFNMDLFTHLFTLLTILNVAYAKCAGLPGKCSCDFANKISCVRVGLVRIPQNERISQHRIETMVLHGNYIRFVDDADLTEYTDLRVLDVRFQGHHRCVHVNTTRQILIKGACEMVSCHTLCGNIRERF